MLFDDQVGQGLYAVKVDLRKLNIVASGCLAPFEGLANSCDLILPAAKPEGLFITCKHLSMDDKALMSKGSVWDAEDYYIKFILCQACVIEAQHFENEFQAQARICPICIDDHSITRPCKNADLISRIQYFTKKVRILKEQRNIELRTNLTGLRMTDKQIDMAIKKLDEELSERMKAK